jgi:Asp/Glu/hydantoin racemase
MRLFYQSLGVTRRSTSGDYAQRLSAILARAASPGTSVELRGLSEGRAIADQYRYLEYLDTAEILDNGLAAERDGYDAFLIGNIFEPGLHALRELLSIPVLGLCEASVFLACLMGPSFSVVNVNPKFARRVTENIASYGLSSRLVSIDRMQVERPAVFDRAFAESAVRDRRRERDPSRRHRHDFARRGRRARGRRSAGRQRPPRARQVRRAGCLDEAADRPLHQQAPHLRAAFRRPARRHPADLRQPRLPRRKLTL